MPSGESSSRVSKSADVFADVPDFAVADASQLTRLWPRSSGGAVESPWAPADLGPLLRHQLASPAPAAPGTRAALTFRDALFANPSAAEALPALRNIKDWAKPQMSRNDGDVPREVAGVIYFAAILSARVRFGERLSELDDSRLRDAAAWVQRQPWLDEGLRELFHLAESSLKPRG